MVPTPYSLLAKLRLPNQGEAWHRFVEIYTPFLMAWAKRQGFQPTDAEDLTQEILVKVMQNLATYDPARGPFRRWLSTISHHASVDFRRRRRNQPLPGAEGLHQVDDGRQALVEFEEAEHTRWLLHKGLSLIRDKFNDTTWTAFTEVMLHERPAQAVAVELGLTEVAVYLARGRVLRHLKQALEGLLG